MFKHVLQNFTRISLVALLGCFAATQSFAQCVNPPAVPAAAVQSANCGQAATLTASGSTGNYAWYNVPVGGTAVGVGNSFTTPVLYSSTTYYVAAYQSGNPSCLSSRVALIVSPSLLASPSVQGATVTCGASATIYAAGSTGNYFWYAGPTGGPVLATGGSFTASVTQTTIFYVEAASTANPTQSATFNYTGGQQNWTVPAGVFSIDFDVRGAQGGSNTWNTGGTGGRVSGKLAVTPGQTIYFYVGQQPGSGGCCNYISAPGGWNGGGAGYSYYNGDQARGGGGASDIRIGGTGTNNRVVVAGGGGGAGGQACNGDQDRGGNGGGLTGQSGWRCSSNDLCYVGAGGSQNAGGQGAQCGSGQNGSLAQGGNAWGAYQNYCCPYPSGGGGGGYYGGGGGYNMGGGGGGSSYADPNASSSVVHTQGFQSGNGQIVINYVTPYCTSARVPVQVATTPIPNPTVAAANLTCGDTALLQATGTGFFNWYSASTGGTLLQGNSANYSIPFVTDSMTVWVEALSTANPGGTVNFSYTGGTQTWVVPAGVYSVVVDAKGAQGGTPSCNSGSTGGNGGRVQASLAVTPGQTLYINIGGTTTTPNAGWNGGGQGGTVSCNSFCQSAGGGGGTDLRIGGQNLNNRVIVAGGGGGGGSWCNSERGGAGGGTTGQQGYRCNSQDCYTGTGGSQTAGGQAGNCCNTGQNGAFGIGGDAYGCAYAGGGGGGWYGGGGGTGCWSGGGGGGGSSYADANLCSNVTHTQGSQSGDGELSISYTVPYCQSQRVAVNVNVSPLAAPTNVIGDSVLCGQTAVVSATPANTPVHWYSNLTNNTPIAIGSSVFLPAMYGSDTLFATSARTNTLSGTHTFSFTGSAQTWTVPAGVTSVSIDMSGAEGGSAVSNPSQNLGGKGGRVQTTLSVTPGQILNIYVGEKPSATTGGWNGGGNGGGNSGGGGGGTDIRLGGITLQDRILSAGAGGGAGWACGNNDYGGDGGGSGNAGNGIRCGSQNSCHCGFGASPSAGGQASQCGCNNQSEYGSLGDGGDFDNCYGNGGGGGGGHYGGGGGGDGGGGGGSSYADPNITSNTVHTQGYRIGHGEVVISYNTTLICQSARVPAVVHIDSLPAPTVSAGVLFCDQGSTTFNVSGGPNTDYRWFDGFSGNLVGLGTSYTTPVLTQTDTLFVLYMQNGCPSKYDMGIVTIVPTPRVDVLPMGPFCSSDAPVNGNLGLVYNTGTMTFTNAGKTGQNGPTQFDADNAYGPGVVNVVSGIQQWVVPVTGNYTIEAFGASGGDVTSNNQGGLGARMRGSFQLQAGQTLNMMVGQMGGLPSDDWNHGGGGGGGTFVTLGTNPSTASALIVAGGGGGGTAAYQNVNQPGEGGQTTNNGDNGGNPGDYCDSGGGGFDGNSTCNGNAKSYKNGGKGGQSNFAGHGGFGGGGAAIWHPGGGGGGYEGGQGGFNHSSSTARGGGSFNIGTNQSNTANANFGHGRVVITGPMTSQPSTGGGVWTGTGVVDSILGTFDPGQAQIGTNTFVYSVNDNGCIGADSVTISVIQGPDATITSPAAVYCDYDGQDTLVALNPNGTWSGTGITGNNTQAFFTPSANGAGTYYAYYTIVDNASGCTDRDSVMLTVNPSPDASLMTPSLLCSNGAPTNLVPNTPGGTFSGNGIVNAQLGTFDPTNNVTGTSQVFYTVTVNNCTSNDSIAIVVNQAPNASFVNPPAQVCEQGNTVYLSNVSPGGFWAGGGITNQMSSAFTPSVAGQGMATVTYQVSNQFCTDYDTAFIFVYGNPTVSLSGSNNQVLCANNTLVLNASGASVYNWYNNGNLITGAFGPTYTVTTPGTYSVKGTNINGCPDFSQDVVVTQGAQPIIYQISVPTVCEGNPTTFTQTSAPGNGNTLVSFNWNFGNGNNGNGFSATETYAQAGIYNAMLTVTNTDGCSDSMMQVVQVWANPSIDSIMAINNCYPNPTTMNSYVSGPSIASWNWNISGQNPVFGASPVVNFPSQGTFNYVLTVTSTDGCVSTLDSSITIYPRPTANFVASDVCQYDSLQFTDLSTGNIAFWNWDFGQATDTVANPIYAFGTTGNIPVSLTVTTPDGCSDVITQTVNVRPTPVSTWFSNNVGIDQLTFNPSVYPLFGGNFYWTFGDGTSSFAPNPTKTYANSGWYTVCLTVEKEGCESTSCDSVRAYDIFSIAELDGGQGVQVYPNPFGQEFNMAFTLTQGAAVTADIRDLTGRLLGDFDFGQLPVGTHRLPVRTEAMDLSAGIYLLNVHINGQTLVTRIVKD